MSQDYLKKISAYNIRKARPDPERCALLVIDMQQYFFQIASRILHHILSIVEACRLRGVKIIFTRHGHVNIERDGGMLSQWWGDYISYGSDEWHLVRALSPLDGEVVLDKNRYSAFAGTKLNDILRSGGIDEVLITGVMSNCCCETTARDAFVRDYRVFFVSDATATVNEELHLASLKNLAYGFAHILDSRQVLDAFSSEGFDLI